LRRGREATLQVFEMLAKPVQRAIVKRWGEGFQFTEPQLKAIPLILKGVNLLLVAPTATGKTEAAILPILSQLVSIPERPPGIKILYITPLRALNRDMLDRLNWWGGELGVKVAVRHGDTEVSERTKQARFPPEMLITTPETLQAVMSGFIMRRHLRQVRWVVIDEVHELAEDKRGSQLSLGLERLRWIANHDFQVVGLSATVGTPEVVAKYLVGVDRPVEVVKVSTARMMKLKVVYPDVSPEDYELAARLYTHPEVASRLRLIRSLVEKHRSTLLFVNTRAIAEVLSSRFHVWDLNFPVSVHHGSLSKPSRIEAERGLKSGSLKGLICTSSLELGIDVGRIDLVIQYNSPRQVTRLVQRIGRSGHGVGRTAKGVIITADPDDTLEAMVICRKAVNEELEPVKIPEKPLDALNHQIVGALMNKKKWKLNELLNLFLKAYPYRNLTGEDVRKVLSYMHSRYPRLAWFDESDGTILAPRNTRPAYEYFFEELSMIPDEKSYLVVDEATNTPVGTLDEPFVAEFGEPGVKFTFRGSLWRIRSILGSEIYVTPVNDPTGAIPSWVGEEIPVPFSVAQEVGGIRRIVEDKLKSGSSLEDVAKLLKKNYSADEETIIRAIGELKDQVESGFPVPTDRRILVELWGDLAVIHVHLGTLGNRTLARVLGDAVAEVLGYTVMVQQDPYRIVLQTGGKLKPEDIRDLLIKLGEEEVEGRVKRAIWRFNLFKRRVIHVARRFGALAKGVDVVNISAKKLAEAFEGTVIEDESVREFLSADMEVDTLNLFLRDLKSGKLEVIAIRSSKPSPITARALERMARKTELIPPERLQRIIIESAKARLLNESRYLICTNCWDWYAPVRVKDLSDHPSCPRCSSRALAPLDVDESLILKLVKKRGEPSTTDERRIVEWALSVAPLVDKYGKVALIVLAGRRIDADDAKQILSKTSSLNDELVSLVVEAEKKALRRRLWP